MKQLKKSLSLLLALVMLVSSMAFSASAATYPDTEGNKYEKAINLVSSLGIMTGYEDGTFGPEKALTRAEYCMVLCRMLGLEDILDSTTYVFFEDVLEEHWAAKAISAIFSMGYASGYGDGNFGPEDSVLYRDAVKMTVNALGYGFMAEEAGGYPNGYMTTASDNGLLKSITGEVGDQPMTRGALAQLVYNALNLELLEEVYTSDGNIAYQKGDETLLTRVFDAVKAEGQVTANGVTNLLGSKPVGSDEVRINGVLYKVGSTDAASYLGYNVEFYYTTNDDGEYILLMCTVKSTTNKTLKLDAEVIADYTSQVASGTITYIINETTGKTTDVDLSSNPSVVYNGKKVSPVTSTGATNPDYSLNILMPANGSVTLIDNDGDGTYDVLSIEAIETYIVNGIDKNKKYVYLKADADAGKTETLIDLSNADDKEYNFTFIKDGEEIDFTALAEWDILSILKSLDGKSYTVYVSTEAVNGYISRVGRNEDGSMGSVVIEGVEYDVVPDYYSDEIEAGLTGTFFLDYTGKIAAYDSASSGTARYVYLMAVDNQSTRLTTDISIKVCTTAGSFATYALNEELYFTGYLNGVWVTDKKVEATELYSGALTTDGVVNDQLIIIGTDDANKINEIQMACDVNTSGDDYEEKLFSQDLSTKRYGTTATDFNLPRSRDTVGLEAVLPNSSPIFVITRMEGENSIEENRITIKYRRDESVFNDSGNVTLSAYDISSGGSIPVAVMYSTGKTVADTIGSYRVESGVKLMMVNEVVQGLNEDEDPITIISGLSNGQAAEIVPSTTKLSMAGRGNGTFYYDNYLVDRAIADGNADADAWELLSYLKPGDIFWYDTNADGLMEIYRPLLGRLEYATNEDGSTDSSKLVQYNPTGNVAMPNPAIGNNNSTVAYNGGYDHYAETLELFGTAYDKDPATNTFRYQCTWGGDENYILANYCGGFVCVYDVETETFKSGSLADMVTYKQAGEYANKVLVHTEYSFPDWVLIYQ